MRARWYEPGTGRFVSEDPAQNDVNWYNYGGNNPTSYVDYNGKSRSYAETMGTISATAIMSGVGGGMATFIYQVVSSAALQGKVQVDISDILAATLLGACVGLFAADYEVLQLSWLKAAEYGNATARSVTAGTALYSGILALVEHKNVSENLENALCSDWDVQW